MVYNVKMINTYITSQEALIPHYIQGEQITYLNIWS